MRPQLQRPIRPNSVSPLNESSGDCDCAGAFTPRLRRCRISGGTKLNQPRRKRLRVKHACSFDLNPPGRRSRRAEFSRPRRHPPASTSGIFSHQIRPGKLAATCRLRDPVLVSLNSESSPLAAMPISARAAATTPVQRLGVVFAHLTQPYQPSPKLQSGRPAHRPFRGLLSVHSRCGPHTRAVTNS